ncbi:MAG TPA: hypothetical protein VFG76_06005, partial [Candidatus Polarisedimenticolia bacterium]|nr:hypothetical protein [Candidatus Polarisedimenticolia bacterium]
GKSTLGLSLLSRPGARLLSDNLLFHDEERVYSCPEPIRLDQAAVEGIAQGGLPPERTNLPLSAHPKPTYRVAASRRAEAAQPAAVFFLRFAPEPGLTPIDSSRAAEMLAAGSDLAREIKDFRPCAALLTTLSAESGGPAPAAHADLARLLRSTTCAIFKIGTGESVARTASRLEESLGTAR